MTAPSLSNGDYRSERKYVSNTLSSHQVEAIVKLHPALFVEAYHPRDVNNIYLDTVSFQHYQDNVDGLRDRVKARVRWYGDLFGRIEQPQLELKIKHGHAMRKQVYSLPAFTFDQDFRFEELSDAILNAEMPAIVRTGVVCLSPTLLNRYRRKYFVTPCHPFRITIDWDLCYFRIVPQRNLFLQKQVARNDLIIELKYPVDEEQGASAIASGLPFHLDRNSKYVNGIEQVYFGSISQPSSALPLIAQPPCEADRAITATQVNESLSNRGAQSWNSHPGIPDSKSGSRRTFSLAGMCLSKDKI